MIESTGRTHKETRFTTKIRVGETIGIDDAHETWCIEGVTLIMKAPKLFTLCLGETNRTQVGIILCLRSGMTPTTLVQFESRPNVLTLDSISFLVNQCMLRDIPRRNTTKVGIGPTILPRSCGWCDPLHMKILKNHTFKA